MSHLRRAIKRYRALRELGIIDLAGKRHRLIPWWRAWRHAWRETA